jgi:hypothetical protein
VPNPIRRFPGRLAHALHDPGALFDLCRGTLLFVVGLWFLHPYWAHLRYPGITREMETMFSLRTWAVICVTVGGTTMVSVVARWFTILTVFYFISFSIWLALFLIFIQTIAPPLESYLSFVIALYTLFRIVNLPGDYPGNETGPGPRLRLGHRSALASSLSSSSPASSSALFSTPPSSFRSSEVRPYAD